MFAQRLKHTHAKLREKAQPVISKLVLAQLDAVGLAFHRMSLGAFMALSEEDPVQTYMESGPSLFCSCCGERWHAFSHAKCPNGCPWVYTSFRAPAWAEDEELLQRVQKRHQVNLIRVVEEDRQSPTSSTNDHGEQRWPTADGKIPRA
jgi:hypothetical protein